jgi:hypothetical protein
MNIPESSPMPAEISEQLALLQRQVFMLLLMLVVIGGSFVASLCYQSRQFGKAIDNLNRKAAPIAQIYQKDFAVIQPFFQQLAAYGQKHPDFQQAVLNKFHITPESVATPKTAAAKK